MDNNLAFGDREDRFYFKGREVSPLELIYEYPIKEDECFEKVVNSFINDGFEIKERTHGCARIFNKNYNHVFDITLYNIKVNDQYYLYYCKDFDKFYLMSGR